MMGPCPVLIIAAPVVFHPSHSISPLTISPSLLAQMMSKISARDVFYGYSDQTLPDRLKTDQ